MHYLLQQTIQHSAARLPDKVAYRTDEDELTFAELDRKTDQLADQLLELGVQKSDRVGVYLHQSLEGMISIFGVLKAGAAFVPFDPSLPVERIRFMLNDCGVKVMISENRRLKTLEEAAAESPLTTIIGPSRTASDENLAVISWQHVYGRETDGASEIPGLMEEDLAYIMYTSGSTGTPKGLMHTHRSGLAYARLSAVNYDAHEDDIFANHAPLHFDISTFGSFTAPMVGMTTLILPEAYKMLPASLSELIQDEGVTIWYSVTTALTELLLKGDLDNRDLSRLRIVSWGGEVFPPKQLEAFMRRLPDALFKNVYGPAEVNQCTWFDVPPLPNAYATEPVPIGRALPGNDWMIFNLDDEPVTPGESGELLIASPTRMQGYWNRPDLTEQGFYRHKPFPDAPFEKIFYRTGDMVQEREDGELLFFGRKDRQVKVRGFRVELDEVELAVSSFAGIAEAAVYTVRDQNDGLSIEASIIVEHNAPLDTKHLIDHVAGRVPGYAKPTSVVVHTTFPRTGSGKINRRQLQSMAQDKLTQTWKDN